MNKFLRPILFFVFLFFVPFSLSVSLAAECRTTCSTIEECQRFIDECNQVVDLYQSANLKNKETLAEFEVQIKRLEQMINLAIREIGKIKEDIVEREADLEIQKMLLAERVRRLYIYQRGYSAFEILFASKNSSFLIRNLFYQQFLAREDKKEIELIGKKLSDLRNDKENLEKQSLRLGAQKKAVEEKVAFFRNEIKKTENYLGQLTSNIAGLSTKQKSLLAARSGSFTSSVGEVPVSVIPCSGPPGSPNFCDPGGGVWFAAFSFGAWTHRKGMSQYGAKGRAEAGQSAEQILQSYYGRTPVDKDTSGTISVSGYGNLDFENYYLLGIAEMPSSWHKEALKAQAIAARTYAYRYKVNGQTICPTESCQVFSKSKADNPPPEWRQAVEETKGKIIDGVITFYSSTAGGYLTTLGWDTTDGQGGPGFASRAWESKGGSPWFYSSWYTQSYLANSAKCGRSHPWLNNEEISDILNAYLVLQKNGHDDRILPVTLSSCPFSGVSGNPYSKEELKNKAEEVGGAVVSVSNVSVVYSNDGYTSEVIFETNLGSLKISGGDFKQAFNLRAPGYIAIRSPLFNIEKK